MFHRFLGYYKGQLHLFVIDIIAAITVAGIDLAFPQILRSLTGGLFTQGSTPSWARWRTSPWDWCACTRFALRAATS